MNFPEIVDDVAKHFTGDVLVAQTAIRVQQGTGAARWLAGKAGISDRQARRWMSSTPPTSRVSAIIRHAPSNLVAAHIFRIASSIDVGVITVEYDDDDQGTRGPIGTIQVDSEVGGFLAQSASALEVGQLEVAAEDFSNAIVNGYDPGLEVTLEVVDVDVININY
jgi:hypothetical protein